MRKLRITACLAGAALLAGCAQPPAGQTCRDMPHPTQCRNQRRTGDLLGGALIGGAGGAIIGALTGNAAEGAAIGAGAGALGGALVPEGSPSPRGYYQPGYQSYQAPQYYNYRSEQLSCGQNGVDFTDILHSCPGD